VNFKNKTAIVTGGARDIGRAVTIALAEAGANVAMNYFSSGESAEETLAAARKLAPQTIGVRADVTRESGAKSVVEACIGAFGPRIDILVNVAGGIIARRTLAEMDAEFLETVMRLNFTSTFLMTAATAPHMGEGGAIVNLSSQAGRDGGGRGASAYSAAKGAVMTFTRSMAKELGPSGIRVNALCPGMISTTFHDSFTPKEVRTSVAAGTPLRREGAAHEIASAVCFLASDQAAFVSGACLDINGGSLMS
jgi:3-oxoacyl-[acyl-carrier protein] reductase